jgi:hypothetical protein
MSLLNQIRHDLLCKARLQPGEVDALLAHPELAVETAKPTPTQVILRDILRQSPEAAVLRRALGTFERDLHRPAGSEAPAVAEAATDEQAEQLGHTASNPAIDGLVDPPTGGNGD